MKEATENTIVAEEPKKGKVKQGNKPETTTVDGEKKPRAARVPANTEYRILDGVDPGKFRGQRQIVVKALQGLGKGFFTAEQVAAKCDGLVSKTPVIASATYHLKGLVADKQVEQVIPAPVETAEAEKKNAA